ncbi:MAG: cell division protein ZapA [bacterium]
MSTPDGESVLKRAYPIRVLGRTLTIQSAAPRESVEAVTSLVIRTMEEIRNRSRSTDVAEIAILTALNLAADYVRVRDDLDEARGQVKEWADAMCDRLDAQLA